jgi:hypothetical protein
MNSPNSTQTPIHRLMLISAALLVYANGAFAADFVGDAQMHASALLSGTSGSHPNAVDNRITSPTDGHQMSTVDVQEQMRRLLLGTPNLARITSPPISVKSKRSQKSAVSVRHSPAYVDAMESARRTILGIGG